jgi:uncharacterized small protein (DUF1192 family)
MKSFKSKWFAPAITAGFVAFAQPQPAFSQNSPPASSQALLQKVKQDQMDQRIALKQTEIDRLKNDLDKAKLDMDAMQRNLDATNSLIVESGSSMDSLAAQEKHLEQTLDLTETRIEAERKNGDGLKSLSIAQTKALEAINQRMAEMDIRSQVRQAEVQLLSQGKPVPGEDNDEMGSPDLEKLKKALASSESKTVLAETLAINAMKTATAKMAAANEAAAQAKQMADNLANGTVATVAEKAGDASSKPKTGRTSKRKHTPSPAPSATPEAKGKATPSATPGPKGGSSKH